MKKKAVTDSSLRSELKHQAPDKAVGARQAVVCQDMHYSVCQDIRYTFGS